LTRFRQYLASGTDREILHVFYAGRVWSDLDVPWHYPWVMFAVVLPLGFLLLGLLGLLTPLLQRKPLAASQQSPTTCTFQETSLIVGTILFILLVFSWPGAPVYDGVRLFLMVFPLWAIFVGIGARWLVEHGMFGQWLNNPRVRSVAVFSFVALQGVGLIVYFPCQLSHYSLLIGGLPGAVRLGFEATYWGDTVREPLLAEAARLSPGRPVFFAPNLASFQASAVSITSPALCEAGVVLVELDRPAVSQAPEDHRFAVIYHRRADMTDVDWILKHGRVVMEYGNQGVWLSRLVELDAPLDASARQIRIDRFP
jgi:hypothetical protein